MVFRVVVSRCSMVLKIVEIYGITCAKNIYRFIIRLLPLRDISKPKSILDGEKILNFLLSHILYSLSFNLLTIDCCGKPNASA